MSFCLIFLFGRCNRNSEKLSRTYYNGVVKAWYRKGKAEKDKELKISNEIIESISDV